MAIIRLGHPLGQKPPNTFSDFAWVRAHESELLETYGQGTILVYREQVIGHGKTLTEARAMAEDHFREVDEEITPIMTTLYQRPVLFRVYPHSIRIEE